MSCDGTGDDCTEALQHLFEYLDGELAPDQVAVVAAHVAGCDSCHDEYDLEGLLKHIVRRSCNESAPERLRRRIHVSLTGVTRTTIVESIDADRQQPSPRALHAEGA